MPISTEPSFGPPPNRGITRQLPAPVWAVQFDDTQSGTDLFLELRDAAAQRVFFACVDGARGTLRWLVDAPDAPWWTRLVAVAGGVVLLHTYPNPELPVPRGLWALDAATGTPRWHDPAGTWAGTDGQRLRVDEVGTDGERQSRIRYLTDGQPAAEPLGPPPPARTRVPERYRAGTAYFDTVAGYVERQTGRVPVRELEYLEFADQIVISYYFYAAGQLENDLLVVSQKTGTGWQTRLATEPRVGSTAFVRARRPAHLSSRLHPPACVYDSFSCFGTPFSAEWRADAVCGSGAGRLRLIPLAPSAARGGCTCCTASKTGRRCIPGCESTA
jgi:hypothetical protein